MNKFDVLMSKGFITSHVIRYFVSIKIALFLDY